MTVLVRSEGNTTMKLPELPERRVAVTVRLVDAGLQRMEALLTEEQREPLIHRIHSSIAEGERGELVQRIRKIRADLRAFAAKFELPEKQVDVRQLLNAEISTMWTMLEDCYPKRMKGFGVSFESTLRATLEESLNVLVHQTEDLMARVR